MQCKIFVNLVESRPRMPRSMPGGRKIKASPKPASCPWLMTKKSTIRGKISAQDL